MKTILRLLPAVLGFAAAATAQAAPAAGDARKSAATEITFHEPEKFTDACEDSFGSDRGRDATLAQLSDYLIERTRAVLPDGWRLAVTFNDIDLAGAFEPWRSNGHQDVRIVRDIYPPRMKLEFRLTDATGHVVKEGKRELSDLAFQMKLMINRDDPLRHEKALLDDWVRADLPPAKKK